MIHLLITPTEVHTASSDEEIVQVVIHLLGRGDEAFAIMKNQHESAVPEQDAKSSSDPQPDPSGDQRGAGQEAQAEGADQGQDSPAVVA